MIKVTEQEVLEVIRNTLSLQKDTLTIESGAHNIEAWDSLGHLGILSALDKLFNGEIALIKEVAAAESVSKILQLLDKHSLIDTKK